MNQTTIHQLMATKWIANAESNEHFHGFSMRLATNITLVKDLFFALYPEKKHPASFEKLLKVLEQLFNARSTALKNQDLERLREGNWYQSEQIVGMQLYADRFNKNLNGVTQKLSYFDDLGVNFLHLMPITTRPKGANDGGYAVNAYDKIDPTFGTAADLLDLTAKMRSKKMYLMLDFVVNHTSNEFPWAKKAIAGEAKYQNYYYTYPNREIPNEFEKSLPEIFPETSPGNFTYNAAMQRWVMTVFNSYQWDLNYTNPEVFIAMFTNLMHLVNLGVDVVRFDALAFLWKKIGTDSQNLPEAHQLIALFRLCLQIVAPGTVLLAEAIVAPKQIVKYFGQGNLEGNECEIAYNATFMALLWNSIATRKTLLLHQSLAHLPKKPAEATWINYIRCHDDIGLGFEDQHIYDIGWSAPEHRKFLLDYYCQRLDWSPAKGLLYMYNPNSGDGRITGSAASLLGLEKALLQKDTTKIAQAIKKITMLHAIILSFGGIPMIYAGDEIGTLNDYSFLKEKDKKEDSRWVNRPFQNWQTINTLGKKDSPANQIYATIKNLIAIRKKHTVFADQNNFKLHYSPNPHLFIYQRAATTADTIWIICNFNDTRETITSTFLEGIGCNLNHGIKDLITKKTYSKKKPLHQLDPFEILWLKLI